MNNIIFFLTIISILNHQLLAADIGNIVFYGRGQASLSTHWCSTEDIKSSSGVNVYFPEKGDNQSTNVRNYPFIIYMPDKGKKEYSYIDFSLSNNAIDLLNAVLLKSELRISPPKGEDLIEAGYTCESIGLSCSNLKDYDFEKNEDEWLKNIDIKFYIESSEINNSIYYGDDEKEYYKLEIPIGSLSTKWKEYEGKIYFQNYYENSPYTNFIIKNYSSMPINIHIGNTIFLKNKVIPLLVNGSPASGYTNYSWLINGADALGSEYISSYESDPDQKSALVYSALNKANYAYYVHYIGNTYGPPEAISFNIRAFHVNQLKLKIDNIKEFNLTTDFILDRNCEISNEQEINILLDIRSLVYADSFHLFTNDITGYFLQAYTDENHIKKNLLQKSGDEAYIDKETSKIYFYSINLHCTYPTDLSQFTVVDYDSKTNKHCDISMHNHNDWENNGLSWAWPNIVDSVDSLYKQTIITIDDSNMKTENDIPGMLKKILL